ncbi:tat pathway signal sequence protein [Rutstroemia sp. NJR-2017a WRK4]|nr:tat pathway signal sequence protein [Rutstroemia sp. NJR-2017a WRK4]
MSSAEALAKSNAVKYETRPFLINIHNNTFAGDPRPELDSAWHELFEDIRIRVSSEDLAYYNLTSIPLADGSGYAAELGVHHELHCLVRTSTRWIFQTLISPQKKIRHWIYKDYYLVNETEVELVEWKAHIDHCIEMMRESIMCRADPSLSTFKWLHGDAQSLTAVAEGHHQCVNWQSLLAWVRSQSVPIFEDGILQAP